MCIHQVCTLDPYSTHWTRQVKIMDEYHIEFALRAIRSGRAWLFFYSSIYCVCLGQVLSGSSPMWIGICVDGVAHNSRLKFSIISFVVHCRKFRAE